MKKIWVCASPSPTPPKQFRPAPESEFIRQYLRFTYFIFLSPFKVKLIQSPSTLSSNSIEFKIQPSRVHKVTTGRIHTIILISFTPYIRLAAISVADSDQRLTPPYFVRLTAVVCSTLSKILFLGSLWVLTGQKGWIAIVTEIVNKQQQQNQKIQRRL